ncbi:hypothetical protein HMPREF0645_0182 [Hallella bergensis DSM 17361]|uniref:Uncharacterized protein n=1 Tax=Hallella bergensis DSM 17361 TaxID=585502 RepID=D1PT97_9BACT|nr:hypothetical protein HMPREF0645_0182 [Hallella bergensis DSM 17361]
MKKYFTSNPTIIKPQKLIWGNSDKRLSLPQRHAGSIEKLIF